jgi:hypothetical protein
VEARQYAWPDFGTHRVILAVKVTLQLQLGKMEQCDPLTLRAAILAPHSFWRLAHTLDAEWCGRWANVDTETKLNPSGCLISE